MDNTRVHRNIDLHEVCQEYNYNYKFFSQYSYMLNPIEESFLKIKSYVRSMNINGNTFSLCNMIKSAIASITTSDCEGWFRYVLGNITNCAASLPYHHQ
ncbi:hypothetical protein BDAP_002085 [Binucleata daphniae]